jgi:hypothetical protein
MPGQDLTRGVLHDSLWLPRDANSLIVRIRTTGGAQLTFRQADLTADLTRPEDRRDKFAVMPSWACDGVAVDRRSVAWWTFRRPEEVPLSLLPAEQTDEGSGLHRWPWRRNRNVLGEALATGPLASELGLGTHSPQEITFQLPEHAQQFTATVGIDQAARGGGCVTCRVFRDRDPGQVLWQREFLRGTDPPVRIGPVGLPPAQRLTLTTEFAHERRPAGADPFDVRDHVNWLLPLVTVDLAATARSPLELAEWFPELTGWKPRDDSQPPISLRPWWDKRANRWRIAMVPDADRKISEAKPLELTRTMQISLSNAFVRLAVGRDRTDSTFHLVKLLVDGEPQETTMNGDLGSNAGPSDAHDRYWILWQHVGKQAVVTLQLTPQGDGNSQPAGVLWDTVEFRPLIEDLPGNGRPIVPDVPLTSLEPAAVTGGGIDASKLRRGMLTNDRELNVRDYPFEEGFGTPCNVSLTYPLDMSWRRFVAVVGLADGWQDVGPYEILLDGEPHFQTADPAHFGRNSPGRQLDVEIPRGCNTITLKVSGSDSQAAWANAGFMRE